MHCQGISVINHKKNDKDIQRNSLVIEPIEIIEKIKSSFLGREKKVYFPQADGMAKAFPEAGKNEYKEG